MTDTYGCHTIYTDTEKADITDFAVLKNYKSSTLTCSIQTKLQQLRFYHQSSRRLLEMQEKGPPVILLKPQIIFPSIKNKRL
jgi:hypothetical protein